ncbi:MAG: hypothetical protein RJQ14_07975, partial [Marinoscillum sp.]
MGTFTVTYSYTDANGCTRTDTKNITVSVPDPIDAGPNITACTSSPSIDVDLGVSITGGTWSGSGITGSFFSPSSVGPGNYILTYIYNNGQGCISTDTRNVNVREELAVDLGDPLTMCRGDLPIDLGQIPNIKGGTWSGRGVDGSNFFNPAAAGAGTFVLTYSITNEFGCTATETLTTTVLSPPVITAGANLTVCTDDSNINLMADAFPPGGSFSGNGVIGSTFYPYVAGIGQNPVTYTYTDGNGCSSSVVRTITVNAKPIVEAGSNFDICVNASPVELQGAIPQNGNWSGPGVIANVFDPLSVGVGAHKIFYSFTDAVGCNNLDSITVNVLAEPTLIIGAPLSVCIDDSPINLALDANIQGGEFDGDGVTGTFFDPDRAGPGSTIISYELRFSGCTITAFRNITVNENTEVDIGEDLVMCIDSNPYRLTDDIDVFGGTFSGTGVSGNNFFDPSVSGLGSFLISYDYTNAF